MAVSPEIPVSSDQHDTDNRAIDAATRVERDLRRFLHELAGLVDGVRRSVHLAQDRLETPDLSASKFEAARASLDTASAGLEQLTELVIAVRAGGSETPPVPGLGASLRENIWDAIELVRPAATARGIELLVDLDSALTRCPPLPIFAVVRNALRNAVEASIESKHDAPAIRISARVRTGQLELTVLDEGPGLPRDMPRRSPFREGFTTKPQGMGIGLALCQDIVDGMGGAVELRNREDRPSGCAFLLRVPLVEVTGKPK